MQGLGSAITYARRYALMAIVGLAPEDDDGNKAAESPAPRVAQKQAAPATKEKPPHVIEAERIVAAIKDCGSIAALDKLEKAEEQAMEDIAEASIATHAHIKTVIAKAREDIAAMEQREIEAA